MNELFKIRLKKGDTVVVRAGREKGKTGKVVAVHPKENKVTVEGINVVKRHTKPTRSNPTGGILEVTKPVHVAKVSIVEPTTKKASRIGIVLNKDGSKSRVFKSTGKEIK